MKKGTANFLPKMLVLGTLIPIIGCAEPDSGNVNTQSQPLPATETISADIQEGVVGGTLIETLEVSAKVTAIDTANRNLSLKNSEGDEFNIQVGPEAVNFDQIQVGDIVNASIVKELVVGLMAANDALPDGRAVKSLGYIEPIEEAAPDGTTGIVALAAKGSQPGGLMAQTTQITATVEAIDEVNRTATLTLEDGSTRVVPVRDDIDLSQRKVGEKVVFHVTEMVAISVEKP